MNTISKLNSQTDSPLQKLMTKLKKALFSAFEFLLFPPVSVFPET